MTYFYYFNKIATLKIIQLIVPEKSDNRHPVPTVSDKTVEAGTPISSYELENVGEAERSEAKDLLYTEILRMTAPTGFSTVST